jgi:hypothetical protein
MRTNLLPNDNDDDEAKIDHTFKVTFSNIESL